VSLLPFDPRTQIYYEIWLWTEPVLWLSYILVVYELYSLVLKQYRGIYSVGRRFFFVLSRNLLIHATITTCS
jgi:hypothetical protein